MKIAILPALLLVLPLSACAELSGATHAPAEIGDVARTETFVLENAALRREWSVRNGRLKTSSIVNKLAGTTSTPGESDEFRLRISDDMDREDANRHTLTAADFTVAGIERKTEGGADTLVFHLKNKELDADLKVSLAKDDSWLRKRLTLVALRPLTLARIDTEALALDGARQPYTTFKITTNVAEEWKPGLGQPLYGDKDATFWGIEFPAATNTVAEGRIVCGHLYGRALKVGEPYVGRPYVMGVGDDARFIQDAFFDYIDRTRVSPFRVRVMYNTWFDFLTFVDKNNFAGSVAKIHKELVAKRGVDPFDAYVIDDGWQDTGVSWAGKVWPANAKFDADFASSRAAAAAAKSHIGLWMSPAMAFGASRKVPALKAEGYETLGQFASIAGPRYMGALEDRMAGLAAQGVAFFKLDGLFGHYILREFELHGKRYGLPEMPQLGTDGFRPDDARLNTPKYDDLKLCYLVAGTEALMRNFDRMHAVNPKVSIVISNGTYLSPWWLQHCEYSWMVNAGDADDRFPRTTQLNYRDAILHDIAVKERTQFPLNAIFNHEPRKTKTEDPEVFRRYLFMAFSRGTGLLDLYLQPSSLKASDWSVLAECLRWARATGPDFKRSRMHGGDPRKGEVYGFTGWSKESGYISLRNPGGRPVAHSLKLDRAFGLVPGSGPFLVSSPLASGAKGLKDRYGYGDTLELTLAPHEIRILDFRVEPHGNPALVPATDLRGEQADVHSPVTLRWKGNAPFYEVSRDGQVIAECVNGTSFADEDAPVWKDRTTYSVRPVGAIGAAAAPCALKFTARTLGPTPPKPTVSLTTLKPVKAAVGWGQMQIGKSVGGAPLSLGGEAYGDGIGLHARAEVTYEVPQGAKRFVAIAGLQDGILGSIRCTALAEDAAGKILKLSETPVLRHDLRVRCWPFDCALPAGTVKLRLVVDDAGDGITSDHADWVNAGFMAE